MPSINNPKLVGLTRIAYTGLLMFYPRDLRRRFGDEMADLFEDLIRDAAARQGLRGVATAWASAFWEVLTVAAPSRLASNAAMAGALSFLASSALFLVFFRALN
jgi:hypothetical protein